MTKKYMSKKQRKTYIEVLKYRYGIPARHLKSTKPMPISNRTRFLKTMVRHKILYEIPKLLDGIVLVHYFTKTNAIRYLGTSRYIDKLYTTDYI